MSTALSLVTNLMDVMDSSEMKQEEKEANKGSKPTTKHFIRHIENIVFDAIDGELYTNPLLTRLYTSDPSIKVVYRSDWDKGKVALISGGGSGHEPCFFGWVGKGMLTAAVCGEIFASPTTKAIVSAILAVGSKEKGVLLIITNYTGDVLNFNLAAQICKTKYGIPCETLSLCDDIALPRSNLPSIGRRGLAGGVLIHKIAGYYAEMGHSLTEIQSICAECAQSLGTVGIAGSVCHLIGTKSANEMDTNVLELGYGVHGEPGFETIEFDSIENVIPKMMALFNDFTQKRNYLKFMQTHQSLRSDTQLRIAVLLNNLGGVTEIEMSVIKKYLLECIVCHGGLGENIEIARVYCGKFETSLDMKGFSVSIMKVNCEILKALDFEIEIKAWKKGEILQMNAVTQSRNNQSMSSEPQISIFDSSEDSKEDLQMSDKGCDVLRLCIESVCESILENKDLLNELDNICGDGDCGTTLEFGAKQLLTNMDKFKDCKSLRLTLQRIAQILSDMGGSSGALYGYLFISASRQVSNLSSMTALNICKAFKLAIRALSEYGKAKQNDRTMMDALMPAIDKILEVYSKDENDHKNALTQGAKAASQGCQNTQQMIARFGRSSYVAVNKQRQCVDPGAKAVAICFNRLCRVICDKL